MASCPQCGVTVGARQRLCRACSRTLDPARSGEGLLGRLRRWFSGSGRSGGGVSRVTVSGRVTLVGNEGGHGDAADLAALPPEVRAALERARQDAAGGVAGAKVTTVGPVQVTTQTVTRTYHSLAEIPPELRQRAEAALRSGTAKSSAAITVEVNGQQRTYSRIEEVPEPYRQAVNEARRKAGQG
jgi:hypothetical protein